MNNIENNNDENNKIEKKSRNRACKSERYIEEREKIIKELEEIIGLTNKKGSILLYDLEHNDELNEYLKSNIEEIKKMWKTGNWNYFVRQHTKEGENISMISLLKSILKNENYEITNRRKITERNNEKKVFIELYFNKK